MEVVDSHAAMLSNQEVLTLLKDLQSGQKGLKKPTKRQQNLATISYETIKYLEDSPCKYQDATQVRDLMKNLEPFKLTKAEKLQILNQKPTTAVEIQLLVEESEERLTEEQIEELLDIISNSLPTPDTEEPMDSGE